jgi:sigma-B regulation protein RsbU (phosphoserine phosphatase)
MDESTPLRILLVEDDEDDYVVTRDLLADAGCASCVLDWADTGERALEVIAAERHDVYLFDYRIGALTGIDLLREVRQRDLAVPVFLLTGLKDHDVDLEAMQAGATDYLVKGQITAALLERALRYAVRHHHTLQALLESERMLAEARAHEALVGARIQNAILLGTPPELRGGAEVAALAMPSQTIDGDFYGFFPYHDHCFDVVLGDVMGKGIPAALLGAAAKIQFLRAVSHLVVTNQGRPPAPADVANLVHVVITPELQSLGSFITAALVRVDLDRRVLDLVDCGHTRTLHLVAASGRCTPLEGVNLPFGFDANEVYRSVGVSFHTGDRFLLYSDGVLDTQAPGGERFGLLRLIALVERRAAEAPRAVLAALKAELLAFSAGASPVDDVTAVLIATSGGIGSGVLHRERRFAAELDLLPAVRSFVRATALSAPGMIVDDDLVAELELAVDETAANIVRHALAQRPGATYEVAVDVLAPDVEVRFRHQGAGFDPAAVPPPAFDGSREGGFGLYVVRRVADRIEYRDAPDGGHEVVLTKRLRRG